MALLVNTALTIMLNPGSVSTISDSPRPQPQFRCLLSSAPARRSHHPQSFHKYAFFPGKIPANPPAFSISSQLEVSQNCRPSRC
nr:hypothetical protein Itr_chr08CG09970 [Ipomoea trifida]GMC70370.1 hypothetical protein Iba_chr03aCG15250 [Ipomoea batatas]GMD30417.1 hypothetical protein Iba_chr09aCG6800 [Ipomoea batatas]